MLSKVLRLAPSCAVAAFCSTGWAGTVEVAYINPGNYSDAGVSATEERANVEALGLHLRRLGERLLPPGHVLRIQVLDVDLAGAVRPNHRGTPLRILRGLADFPAMHLRYTLEVPGQPARTGEDRVSDMNYTRGAASPRASAPLHYEKRMLEKWFAERFAS